MRMIFSEQIRVEKIFSIIVLNRLCIGIQRFCVTVPSFKAWCFCAAWCKIERAFGFGTGILFFLRIRFPCKIERAFWGRNIFLLKILILILIAILILILSLICILILVLGHRMSMRRNLFSNVEYRTVFDIKIRFHQILILAGNHSVMWLVQSVHKSLVLHHSLCKSAGIRVIFIMFLFQILSRIKSLI